MIVTIDGPSGTGKTTVARSAAERLGFVYFDTGAMYRALTWVVLENKIDPTDDEALQLILSQFDFKIQENAYGKRYLVGDTDVTEVIRSRLITQHVSKVAAQRRVREALLQIQHRFVQGKNVIFEGRDLGTVVFPDAEVKIYLHADPQVRAERRLREMPEMDLQVMLKEIIHRDELDANREIAPLRCPEGACCIDTSDLTLEQVIARVVEEVQKVLVA